MKKIFKIISSAILVSGAFLYLGIVFILPMVLNCHTTINKLQSLIQNKTGIETNITGLNLKISPRLKAFLNINSIEAKNNNVTVIDIKNLSLNCKLLQKHLTYISADNVFIDGNTLKQLKKDEKKKNNNKKFELKNLPEIYIKNITFKSDDVSIFAKDINSKNNIIQLNADIKTRFLNEIVKLGYSGALQLLDDRFQANQFGVQIGNSNLYIDGYFVDKEDFIFNVNGEKLPVSEIMPMLLHFQKSKDPSKKFIENFKNFKGTINLNLKVDKSGIWGKGIANNLSGNAVWFNIPIFFKEAVFNFNGQKIDSVAEGILGKEKVIHTLNITDLTTPNREVIGTMKTTLTKKFDYVPNLTVLNSVNFCLVYKVKDKKPDVYYDLDIPVNSDLIYNSFYLGLRDYKRKLHANTLKIDNDLYLKEYKYTYSNSKKENIVILGDGLFQKHVDKLNPDKFIPQYVTVHTNGYAPISVTGSFGEKVSGGQFKGDLKYDFKNNQVLGTFDIVKAKHQEFNIENAHITSKNGVFNVTSNGLFKGEKYSAELSTKNNIYGETLVYNMKLFLDKLIFETSPDSDNKNDDANKKKEETDKKNQEPNNENISKKIQEAKITVNNWEIVINEIKRDKFILKNVNLLGSMKNDIFNFKMKELNFADGTVKAHGMYDFAKDKSKMTFEAKDINSNKAAEMTVNLKDQIEGIANVNVELDAKDMFRLLDAHCIFEVNEGFMPGLADKEFSIKNSKYKFSEITNVDLKQKELMKDDIKGTFDVHNTEINNINITTWHELSAVYIEGNYEMEKQYADLQLFWHYSKEAPKGARIFGIPFSLILKVVFRPEHTREMYQDKLSKIPEINADEKNSNYYRVFIKGDINNKKTNFILKEIK
ncbi:hypothetical protein IJ182_06430 [bacterium]|nr:hypothetical protein [bacterium]